MHGKASKGAWTEEEDQLLATWQLEYGNQWSKIAEHIPGKSGQQCAQRWRHRVNPNISKEKWTEEEDAKLLLLVKKHGHSWAEIARRLPGRTDQQCMGRWRRHVDPSLRKDRWDAEEDQLLLELVEEYGASWSEVSKHITGRTAHHCRMRWCQLTGAEQPSKSARSSKSASSTSSAQFNRRHCQSDAGAAAAANQRRQSTATAGEARVLDGEEGLGFVSPPVATRRPRSARAARRLSGVSEVGMTEELSEDVSPTFTLRKGTARAPPRAAAAAVADAAATAAVEDVPLAPIKASNAAAGIDLLGTAEIQAGVACQFAIPEFQARHRYVAPQQVQQETALAPAPSLGLAAASVLPADPFTVAPAAVADCVACQQPQQQQPVAEVEAAWGSRLSPAAGPAPQQPPAWEGAPAAAAATAEAGPTPLPAAPAANPTLLAAETSAVGSTAAVAVGVAAAGTSTEPKLLSSRPRLVIRPLQLPHAETPVPALPQDEESPELTITALGPNVDLLSPSRTLSHAPTAQRAQLTPPSSGRKRPLPTARLAAFGPRLGALLLPDDGPTAGEQAQGSPPEGGMTPVRPTPGSREDEACALQWGGLTPSVLTLLQSPQPVSVSGDDPLVSPHFGGMLTPEWAKRDPSRQITSDGSQRRLSSGRSRRARGEGQVAGAVASLDFTLLGSSPKKAKTDGDSPPAATGLAVCGAAAPQPAATGDKPWLSKGVGAGAAGSQSAATAAHLLLPETVGRSALAAALQQGLGLASTARTGPPAGLPPGSTLTGMKDAAAAQRAQQGAGAGAPLTSDSVRVQLRSLLENL